MVGVTIKVIVVHGELREIAAVISLDDLMSDAVQARLMSSADIITFSDIQKTSCRAGKRFLLSSHGSRQKPTSLASLAGLT
jgi:hypothetical protein